eukprot:837869-Ditylum_brightwellii.AAC.1
MQGATKSTSCYSASHCIEYPAFGEYSILSSIAPSEGTSILSTLSTPPLGRVYLLHSPTKA